MKEKRWLDSIITCCTLLLLSAILMIVHGHMFMAEGMEEKTLIEVEVKPGDTLWSIADDYYSREVDLRSFIYQIKEMNQLESVLLTPGQRLHLLVEK